MPSRSAGRSGAETTMSSSTLTKLTLTTKSLRSPSSMSRNGDSSAGAHSPSPISPERGSLYSRSRSTFKPDLPYSTSSPMSSASAPKIPATTSTTTTTHAKLHKRASSTNSVSGATSPQTNPQSQFTTSFATIEDPFPEVPTPPALSSSVPKIKPYLRKMSSAKEDQGMIDLSKSTKENDRLAGLGIQDLNVKSASEVSFAHVRRGQQHSRTTSTGSQVSNGSGRYAPTQPFVHPMAKTPRPYTPPSGRSYTNSLNDDEANENDDIVQDDFGLGSGVKTTRSMSISSTPATNPTPLSQSHTVVDFDLVPKLLNTSQTNLSVASHNSETSKAKKKRPRRNTELSQEYNATDSSRTSLDRAFAFRPRRSDPSDTPSREEQILAARRKFEEKEANKDRKQEKEARKRRESDARKEERQRRKSDAQSLPPLKSALKQSHDGNTDTAQTKRRKSSIAAVMGGAEDTAAEKFFAKSYEEHRPSNVASLPTYGTRPGESEKLPRIEYTQASDKGSGGDGGWLRFSTWVQTRMLSCGGRD